MALFARTPRAPLEYSRTLWMRAWVGLVMLFLYAPLIVLMIFSFNDSKRNVVWRGFTTKYYEKALGNDQLVEALINSLTIAALATLASLVLGELARAVARPDLPHDLIKRVPARAADSGRDLCPQHILVLLLKDMTTRTTDKTPVFSQESTLRIRVL